LTAVELLPWAAFLIGTAFGVAGQVSGFCLLSGLRGWWSGGDGRKIRAFALALAVAVILSQLLDAAGYVSLARSAYAQPTLSLVTLVSGGVLFGYGMVMANGCGARSLVLLGGGNLRSFVVLLCIGIAAHMTLTGLIAPLRVAAASAVTVAPGVSPPTLSGLAGTTPWLEKEQARWLVVGLLAAVLTPFAFSHRPFRRDATQIVAALVIGALIPLGWFVTGYLGDDDFDPAPLTSLTFIGPIGDTIQYSMLATGIKASFGVCVVTGVFVGSLATALARRRVQLESFTSPRSMLRYIAGGVLMGTGGALALGCSIGHGLTGLSTLSLASFIAVASIVGGAALGLHGPLRLAPVKP